MNPRSLRTPSGILAASLAGCGAFLFAAALTGMGPFNRSAPWLAPFRLGQGPPRLAAAVRIEGLPGGPQAPLDDALADALGRLRLQGAGVIVVEAWLDALPQADALAFGDSLERRFKALPQGPARRRILGILKDESTRLDASARLAAAIGAARPVLLAFQALPGGGGALPAEIQGRSYTVSLRGVRERLPEYRALRLPFDQALAAASGAGAVPPANRRPVAAVCLGGRWNDGLGLEAARLALGLPLDALRYHWKGAKLFSLELAHRSLPMDPLGRVEPGPVGPDAGPMGPVLAVHPWAGPGAWASGPLRGRVVFLRPRPLPEADARAFDAQEAVFAGLLAPPPAPGGASPRLRADLAAGAFAAAALVGLAPLWAAAIAWGLPPLAALELLPGNPLALARSLALSLAALALGAGWRMLRAQRRRLEADRLLGAHCAPGRQEAWMRALASGRAAVPGVYAVAGPGELAQGDWWADWMGRWGAFLDPGAGPGSLGLVFAGGDAAARAARAMLDLKRRGGGLAAALGTGTVSFRLDQGRGGPTWIVEGPVKERTLALHALALPGQMLLPKSALAEFGALVESRLLTPPPPQGEPAVNILGPRASLLAGRP